MVRTLTAEEAQRFLAAAEDNEYHAPLALALLTGMRRSEIAGLKWGRVDLLGATLRVVEGLHRLRGRGFVTEAPKSARGKRNIDLSPAAVILLRGHKEQEAAKALLTGRSLADDDYVFCRFDGSPIRPDRLSTKFAVIARKAGLTGVSLHSLRHTDASLMLAANIHPKVVSERLGHSTIALTLDTYSHVIPGLQAAAAKRLDDVLAGKVPTETSDPIEAP